MQYKGLLKETIIYSVGSFGSKILSFLLVPLYSFFLTKTEMGEYDIFLTTITLFVPLISLQISEAAYRWLIDKAENATSEYNARIITNTFIIFLMGFLVLILTFAVYFQFNKFKYSQYFIPTLFFSCLLPYLQSLLRGDGKTKEFATNGLITSLLIVILNVVFVYFLKLKVEGILIGNIIANFLASILIIFRLRLHRFFRISLFNKDLARQMLKYSLPLIPNLVSWWLISAASKFIILQDLGIEANGIYAISSRFPSILIIINSVLILPIQDAYLKGVQSDEYFKRIFKNFIKMEIYMVIFLSVGAPIYTKFLVSNEIYEAWKYMPILYLGVAFSTVASLKSLVYQRNRNTVRITVTTFIGGTVSLIFCYFTIDLFGLHGVSLSFLIGYLIMYLLRYYDLKKMNVSFLDAKLYKVIGFVLAYLFAHYLFESSSFTQQVSIFIVVSTALIFANINIFKKFKLRI